MICIKPELSVKITCINCNEPNANVSKIHLIGVHYIAYCDCKLCNELFYYTLPVGHTLRYPVGVFKNGTHVQQSVKSNIKWIVNPLKKAIASPDSTNIEINKTTFFEKKDIIILNCIDHLFGHVLLKILNAQYYLENEKEKGLVIIIPKGFEWFLPQGVAEIWSVNIKLSQTRKWYSKLDNFFQSEISKYQNVFLSLAFAMPDPAQLNIERFTKVPRFNLDSFNSIPKKITFIYREDRLWLRSHFLDNLSVLAKEFKIKPLNLIFLYLQNVKIRRLFKQLKKLLPQAGFAIAGLGKKGNMPKFVTDLRFEKITSETEVELCKLYASSHLVIGLHGSNMLLPTALAAAYIEILPKNRIGNILHDILLPYNGRKQHYLGRFVSNKTSAKEIAFNALQLIEKYQAFEKSMTNNYLKHGIYSDVTKWKQID